MGTQSSNLDLKDLLQDINEGKYQLPDFQRGWVWDDSRICKLLESLFSGYPMGAIMNLEYGGGDTNFKYRLFTGVDDVYSSQTPKGLILDGQQRLTTLYQVLYCKNPVKTYLSKNKKEEEKGLRYYYLDMIKAIDNDHDILDAIISVPSDKKITTDIGRTITLDLSSQANEFKNLCFPINLIYSPIEQDNWYFAYLQYYEFSQEYIQLYQNFKMKYLHKVLSYKIPVIQLDKETKKEAVCQIFENVNTGGVALTVFELVTAIYAADNYQLREKWEEIENCFKILNVNLLKNIEPHHFLMAMSLLVSYKRNLKDNSVVTCKRRDILRLSLVDFKENVDALIQGFKEASNFLVHLGIYKTDNIPYTTQLIPLATIFAFDINTAKKLNLPNNRDLLAQWYWCGVFGELYGSANETRFANDVVEFFEWLDGGKQPDTVSRANFSAMRLLSLTTRNSAAYKGVMALITKDIPLDFFTKEAMDIAVYLEQSTDVHHIYPEVQCRNKYPENRWNSIINKTLIYASSNRSIGGRLPSLYIQTMQNKGLSDETINEILVSHKINMGLLKSDDFYAYTKDRATRLLDRIEIAMGKSVDGRSSEDVIKEFGSEI